MFQLPPIPSWNTLHPLIIHFPIALLLVAPLFIVAGSILKPAKGRSYLITAMVLLLLGTAAIFVAVETGEAAGKLAEQTPGIEGVLESHEALAERTQVVFSVLSVVFVLLLAGPHVLKKVDTRLTTTILPLAFLMFYGIGVMLLVNTAHNGGRLVHEFGVRAMAASSPSNAAQALPMENENDKD